MKEKDCFHSKDILSNNAKIYIGPQVGIGLCLTSIVIIHTSGLDESDDDILFLCSVKSSGVKNGGIYMEYDINLLDEYHSIKTCYNYDDFNNMIRSNLEMFVKLTNGTIDIEPHDTMSFLLNRYQAYLDLYDDIRTEYFMCSLIDDI